MGAKIDIDIVSKTFIITEAPTLVNGEYVLDFDIKIDLYSDAKEDWQADSSLRVRTFPLSAVGGNPTVGSNKLGSTYFIEPDWKIVLYESDHRFRVNGNFYSTDGTSPFLLPVGNSVLLEQQVSNLVDSIADDGSGGSVSTDVNIVSVTGTPVTSVDDFKATETVVDLSGIPKAVWEYIPRTLTDALGLTPEQEAKLDQILIDVDNVPTSLENATEVWDYVLPNDGEEPYPPLFPQGRE